MSRMLWFFLGAGVGAWWTTNKKINIDCHYNRSLSAPIPSDQRAPPPNTSEYMANHRGPYNRDWNEERERVRQFSRNAEDTVAELSEVTLNTILQATEALKAKMAEHRALREEERRIEEERRRNPPRFV